MNLLHLFLDELVHLLFETPLEAVILLLIVSLKLDLKFLVLFDDLLAGGLRLYYLILVALNLSLDGTEIAFGFSELIFQVLNLLFESLNLVL